MERIKHRCSFSCGIAVGCSGVGRERAGGVALLWNDQINISILSFSLNHIHGKVEGEHGAEPWFVTGVYGAEKKGGNPRTFDQFMVGRDATSACELHDLGFIGYPFTWSNGREGLDNVQCRLDRALATGNFIDEYSPIKVMHLPRYGSDHAVISVTLGDVSLGSNKKKVHVFRFEESRYKDNRCEQLVHTTWSGNGGNCLARINSIKSLDNEFVDHRTNEVRKEIVSTERLLQDKSLWSESADDLRKYRELEKTHAELLQKEETLWRQRSRATWLKDGDRNTKFFHGKASQRKKTNCIKKLKDEDGVWWSGQDNVEKVLLHYFDELFSSSSPIDIEQACEAIQKRLSPDHVELCNQRFTSAEIKETVEQMDPLKAQTGFRHFSFKSIGTLWNPSSPKQFRPISLCNVTLKIVTKTIANRIKCILPDVVDEEQSAFVKGRLITDNALIAMECFHWLKKKVKGKKGTMALKLDMAKAYDRM
ncbi:hypothetical protein P8452_57931 [Trifolium repens]|nr:hypothetical protein P8452_57931 [Trifolium repens]